MARFLLTHSLLSAWIYALKDNPYEDATTERNPMEEFMLTLRREPTPTTPTMQKGIDFEDLVTDIVYNRGNRSDKWYDAAAEVAQTVRGGILQYRATKPIEVQGIPLLLYGRLDCLKAGNVIDIKYSAKYDRGKYFASTQHPVYMELIPEARKFTYIVSNGLDVWTEPYLREETPDIYPIISDFFDWLRAVGMMQVYQQHWNTL